MDALVCPPPLLPGPWGKAPPSHFPMQCPTTSKPAKAKREERSTSVSFRGALGYKAGSIATISKDLADEGTLTGYLQYL